MIRYDFDKNLLIYEFKNFAEVIKKNGTHEVWITLKDERGKESLYEMKVKFKIQQSIVNNSDLVEDNLGLAEES